MRAILVGKVRRSGTSKAGKSYDFTACSVTFSALGVEGVQVAVILVDARILHYDALEVGSEYDFDFDCNGHLINVFIED